MSGHFNKAIKSIQAFRHHPTSNNILQISILSPFPSELPLKMFVIFALSSKFLGNLPSLNFLSRA